LGLALAVVAAGAIGLYFYTSAPGPGGSNATTSTSYGINEVSNQGAGYITVQFNGSNYQAVAKGPNSPSFSCPAGTDPSVCTLLEQTCGNGVGSDQEPWKNCLNCAFDAGCTGQQSCDPYTHKCSVLVGACQVAVYGGA
jgi:hypothetical protein